VPTPNKRIAMEHSMVLCLSLHRFSFGCDIEATRHITYHRAIALIASIARNETYIEVHATEKCHCKCRAMTVDTLQLNCRRVLKKAAREGVPEKAFHSVGCRPLATRIAFRIMLEWHSQKSSIVITQANIDLNNSSSSIVGKSISSWFST
jgi:hypothetical protein